MKMREIEDDQGHYMDQAALTDPPAAPSKYMFITHAVVHVGRVRIADWNDAETVAMAGDPPQEPAVAAIIKASALLHQAIMDGIVTTYSRRSSGGGMTQLSAGTWINDYMSSNIARSSGGPAAYGAVYIFVDRDELQRAFAIGAAEQPAPTIENAQAVSDFDVAAPASASIPSGGKLSPPERDSAYQALADRFDAEGVPIRQVDASKIAERWDRANGDPPARDAITSLMKGRPAGRPPAN